jgi:hypothetical protein
LLGARFSCAKTEDPASNSVAIVTGHPAPARRIRAHNPAIVESTPMAAPIPPDREGEHFSHYVPLDRKLSKVARDAEHDHAVHERSKSGHHGGRGAPIKQKIDADGQSLNVGVPGSGRANQETRGHGRVFRHNVTGSQSSRSSAAEPTYRVPTRILRLEKLAILV